MTLAGKTAVVTGAARGIGRACALALADEGARVVAVDRDDCADTVAEIAAMGGTASAAQCDVADEDAVTDLFATGLEDGPLDILLHAAGVIHEKPLLETSAAEFDRVIAVNLRGSFLVGREAIRQMHANGGGRIILVASDMAYYGRETFSPYVASKHGVLGLARSWAKEFAPAITVNAICPGPIDTDMLGPEHMSPEWRQREMDALLLRRFGRPEEVARLAVFLCGPGGDYITGQGLGINGGSVLV